jgi:hypothetical protein
MSVVEQPRNAGLVARVVGILTKPAAEWDAIAGEAATVQSLFAGYACILAAIGPVALIVQHLLFIHWTLPIVVGIALFSYVLSLVGVAIVGFIINALASSFGAKPDSIQAMKLAVYSYTASWVAAGLNIVPVLGILAIIGSIYGLYLYWLGLPKLMQVPEDKAAGYAIVTVLAVIVLNVIIGMIVASIIAMMIIGGVAAGGSLLH